MFLFNKINYDNNIHSCIYFFNFNVNVQLNIYYDRDKDKDNDNDNDVDASFKYNNLETGVYIDNSNIVSLPWVRYGRLVRPNSL